MAETTGKQKVVVVGAGPVGALAALYAANRGDDVHVYELRGGMSIISISSDFLVLLSASCYVEESRHDFSVISIYSCYICFLPLTPLLCSKIVCWVIHFVFNILVDTYSYLSD